MDFKDLIGKTITKATLMKRPDFDDKGWLKLEFSDKSDCIIVSTYGSYTAGSEDEYPSYILIIDKYENELVPVTK